MVFIHDKLNGIIALDAWAGRDSIYMEQYTKMIVKRQDQPGFEKGAAILLTLASFSLVLNQSCNDDDNVQPRLKEFIADNSSFQDWQNWPLEQTYNGPDPRLGAMAHANNDSTAVRNVYFKNGQDRMSDTFPIGTLIVKNTTNEAGTINDFTAMAKRGNNFRPDGGDWEFFLLMPDGTIATDSTGMPMRGANLMDGMCKSCHAGAADKDFVYSK